MGALTATPSVNLPGLSPEMFKLSVMDEDGLISALDYVLVEPGNTPPSAYAGPDKFGFVGETFTLNGSGSFDPDGDSLTYSWSLYSQPSGSAATLSSNQVSTNFTPDIPGIYYASLTVNDGTEDSGIDLVKITAIDPLVYAADQVTAARDIVAGLSRGDFDNRKRQGEMLDEMDGVLAALTAGDSAIAISRIDKLLLRVDGCTLRGSADTKGKEKDWVKTCAAQIQIYNLLTDAKSVL